MGKMPNASLAEIDVIHCLRNTVFFPVYGNTIINAHTYANNAEGGVFFYWRDFFSVQQKYY